MSEKTVNQKKLLVSVADTGRHRQPWGYSSEDSVQAGET